MPKSLLQQSREAAADGRWNEARDLLKQQLEESPSAEALEEIASTCWWLNDFNEVFHYRLEAYEAFVQVSDIKGAARNACWLGMDYLQIKGELAIANGWLQRATNLLSKAGECWELAFITLLKARICFMQHPTNDAALQLVEESLSISKRVGSIEGEMMATGVKGLILTTEGKIREAMSYLDEATLLATTGKVKDFAIAGITCCILIEACKSIRDLERAGQWCRQLKEMAHRWHCDMLFSSCRIQYASVLIWKGEWEAAEQELMIVAGEVEHLHPTHASMLLVQLAELRRKQGRWIEANDLLQQAQVPFIKLLTCAAFAYDQGELEMAGDLVLRYLRQIPSKAKISKVAALELLIRIYSKQRRIEDATNVVNEFEEITAIINTEPVKASLLVCRGIGQDACGDAAAARQYFEDAIDIYDTIGVPFESAATRILLSEVLISQKQYRNAESELITALKVFQRMGAEKHTEKIKQLLKTARRQQVLEQRHEVPEFTGRELEILRLISEGRNNKAIAQQLFLSVRTVEKHLANLYLKMGVYGKSARAFAASYAVKKNLFIS
ncbi:LuxR C-terminal-related transcriptional regulator [Puia dinghuensis]|uniref:HTH luxR-type domain-containing protein n=1 Tax=Puia dinghuensis TaxID=1792502 RepID=A0A8J2XQU7_9BACT|nr:LuxR C-terminal-related transcriptional regulator [Puia dinghuensis]GGA96272.1 hypothetical protein GCM10011511_19460 [Puia dinghuensis]